MQPHKACPLDLKGFSATSPWGLPAVRGTLQGRAACAGCCGSGRRGSKARERRRSRFWEQGQAVPAVKMQGGRFLPRDSVLANIRGDWKWKQIRIGGSDSNTGIWRWFCSGAISCKEINMCDKLPQRAFYRLFSVLFSFQRTTAALLLFSAANSALWSGRGGISA